MVTETQKGATEVSVQLSDCRTEDVRTVFTVLSSVFECDRDSPTPHPAATGAQPDVCSAVFDVAQERGTPAPTALDTGVAAELQGAPHAVDSLRQALTGAFTVREERSAAGDQEKQVWLKLESRTV